VHCQSVICHPVLLGPDLSYLVQADPAALRCSGRTSSTTPTRTGCMSPAPVLRHSGPCTMATTSACSASSRATTLLSGTISERMPLRSSLTSRRVSYRTFASASLKPAKSSVTCIPALYLYLCLDPYHVVQGGFAGVDVVMHVSSPVVGSASSPCEA
jgi:hypothetical protein